VKIVPNITSMNMNKTMMSNMIGNELRIVDTKLLIPGIELIVLSGLNSLKTLIAVTFSTEITSEIHPKMTTRKSRMFQESLK
jgi:hypothetical protein